MASAAIGATLPFSVVGFSCVPVPIALLASTELALAVGWFIGPGYARRTKSATRGNRQRGKSALTHCMLRALARPRAAGYARTMRGRCATP